MVIGRSGGRSDVPSTTLPCGLAKTMPRETTYLYDALVLSLSSFVIPKPQPFFLSLWHALAPIRKMFPVLPSAPLFATLM